MKSILKVGSVLALSLSLVACYKVPTGNVGVKVHLLGTSKGVDMEELGVGRYWVGINEELYLFPTYTQNHTYDGRDKIGFQTREGLTVEADIGITYHVQPDKVTSVFQKYRKGIDEITDTFLRNMIRDSLVKRASALPIESVYGEGKTSLIEQVQQDVQDQTSEIGIVIEKLYWVGELTLPENVIGSINRKIEATQMAEQRENEVRQATAEAQKVVASARGEAEARIAVANADAEAFQIKGEALRNYPEVLEMNKIERWDGTLPRFVGGDSVIPMINLEK